MTSHRFPVDPRDLCPPIELTTASLRAIGEWKPRVLVGKIDKRLAELCDYLVFRLADDLDDTAAPICDDDSRPTDIQAHNREPVRQTFEHHHAAGIMQARKEHDVMRDIKPDQLGARKPGLPINLRRNAQAFREVLPSRLSRAVANHRQAGIRPSYQKASESWDA